MTRRVRCVVWALLAALGPLPARAQQERPLDPALTARLTDLDGRSAAAYLELAEEVAGEADSAVENRLARTLYALAFELDRASGFEQGVGASACLGLAELEPIEGERRWLRALAARADPRYGGATLPGEGPPLPPEVRLDAATALGAARAGDGVRARRLLDSPGVGAALNRFAAVLGMTGASSVASYVESLTRGWPCPRCRGERVVNTAGPGDLARHERCPTCGGDPGPGLTPEQYAAQLRFEARLLDADVRSWAGQLAVDRGAPLRDPDPEELAASLRVDPEAVLWRDGAWTRPGG